jgi:cell fate (sporulation/competence/biofilm development) regulator YlbF (YheA/YmcA/DUF963 family)
MKKILGAFLLSLSFFFSALQAQTSVMSIPLNLQTNSIAETESNFYQTIPRNYSLAERIARHESFIALMLLFDEVLEMPNSDNFIASFDTAILRYQGDNYLSQITGIPINEIQIINQGLINYTSDLIAYFPELQQLSAQDLQAVILQAVEIYSSHSPLAWLNQRPMQIKRILKNTDSFTGSNGLKDTYTTSIEEGYLLSASKSPDSFDPCSDCKRIGRAQMVAYILLGAYTCAGGGFYSIWACATAGFWMAAEQALACIKQHCPQK